jgi:peptide deformylase
MAILKVVKYPDPVLSTRTKEVGKITDTDRKLVRDMIDTMYAENGVGLAANQVGISKRLFVASADQVRGQEMVFFNPVIVRSEGTIKEFEGCLSVPEFYEPVKRAKRVWMRATTLEGKEVEVMGEGLVSRIFQHEIDHLNGILFIDRLGFMKGRSIKKKIISKQSSVGSR